MTLFFRNITHGTKNFCCRYAFLLVVCLYLIFSLMYIDKPGLYMDAVNPDYLASWLLRGNTYQPAWIYPDNILAGSYKYPLLASLYGGDLSAYLGVIFFSVLGFGLIQFKIFHLLLGLGVASAIYWCMYKKWKLPSAIVFSLLLLLAIDSSFILTWRTQYYLQLFPVAFVFISIGFLKNVIDAGASPESKDAFFSGVFLGLATWCYFVFFFYSVSIFLFLFFQYRKQISLKTFKVVALAFVVGWSPYLYAHISMCIKQGFGGYIEALQSLQTTYGVIQTHQSIIDRIIHVFNQFRGILAAQGIEETVFGSRSSHTLINNIFVILFFLVMAMGVASVFFQKDERIRTIGKFFIAIVLSHVALGLFLGKSLGHQHYIMLLPFLYSFIALAAYSSHRDKIRKAGYVVIFCVLLTSFLVTKNSLSRLKNEGGVKYYSDAINLTNAYLSSLPKGAPIIFPQWGYWMQFVVTNGPDREVYHIADLTTLINSPEMMEKLGAYKQYAVVLGDEIKDIPSNEIEEKILKIKENSGMSEIKKTELYNRNHLEKLTVYSFYKLPQVKIDAVGLIKNWGPKFVSAGKGFNIQPGGMSSIWIQINKNLSQNEKVQIYFDGHQIKDVTVSKDLITAVVPVDLYGKIGEYDIEIVGLTETPMLVGKLKAE